MLQQKWRVFIFNYAICKIVTDAVNRTLMSSVKLNIGSVCSLLIKMKLT